MALNDDTSRLVGILDALIPIVMKIEKFEDEETDVHKNVNALHLEALRRKLFDLRISTHSEGYTFYSNGWFICRNFKERELRVEPPSLKR